jgi:hypothetical protein
VRSWKDRPLNKAERAALDALASQSWVVSTAAAYDWLTRRGLAESAGLRIASRSARGCTFKCSWQITNAGRAAHAALKSGGTA